MIIMDNKRNKIDGLEVFVKVQLGIDLTDEERHIYECYDEIEKQVIFDFINDPLFENDLKNIIRKIGHSNKKIKINLGKR